MFLFVLLYELLINAWTQNNIKIVNAQQEKDTHTITR